MKCYRKILRTPWIAHRTNSSIVHLPMNWLHNFVRRQQITLATSLDTTVMQGMVAGKRSREKPRQRWEKYITDIFGTMATESSSSGRGQASISQTFGQRRPEEDLKKSWIYSLSRTAAVGEWLRAWDTLTMFEATVCGRS